MTLLCILIYCVPSKYLDNVLWCFGNLMPIKDRLYQSWLSARKQRDIFQNVKNEKQANQAHGNICNLVVQTKYALDSF